MPNESELLPASNGEEIRNARAGELQKLIEFLREVYRPGYILTDPLYLNWQFRDNPNNPFEGYANRICLNSSDEIIAHVGLIPVKLKLDDLTVNAAFFANVITHPAHRGRGVAKRLVADVHKHFEFILDLGANDLAKAVFTSQEWTGIGNLRRYVKVVRFMGSTRVLADSRLVRALIAVAVLIKLIIARLSVLMHYKHKPRFEQIKIVRIDRSGSRFDLFWNEARRRFRFTVERSSVYMNWRYANHPKLQYMILEGQDIRGNVVGYAVARTEGAPVVKIGRIIDLIILPGFDELFLRAVVEYLMGDQVQLIDFFCCGKRYHSSLVKAGFISGNRFPMSAYPILYNPLSRRKKYIRFMIKPSASWSDRSDLYDQNNWHVTTGDGDRDRPN